MNAVLSPERSPARLLAPGLLAVVLCSAVLIVFRASHGDAFPEGPDLSGPAMLVLAGVSGAMGGFLSLLLQSFLIWVYGRAVGPANGAFVRTLAVVSVALGTTLVLEVAILGAEMLVTGSAPPLPATNLSRYFGPGFEGLDPLGLVTVFIVYVGSKRYLGYGPVAAGVLASLMLATSIAAGALV